MVRRLQTSPATVDTAVPAARCKTERIRNTKYRIAMNWTQEEDACLVKFTSTMTDQELACMLGRTRCAVANRRKKLRLSRMGGNVVNTILDCMDWPYPFVKPRRVQI